ncbi:MAG TPA: APC family permease [Polyangiaceae bacterium]|nr:APC family permease [Polyangiaceae bacterium]
MANDDGARPLGQVSLFALGVNGVVGVGIFFAPAAVASELPGPFGALAYATTALALLPIALGYSALGGRYPVDGGPTVWAREAFGPALAFFVGWLTFVSSLFSLAAVASGLARYSGPVFGVTSDGGIRALAAFCVVTLSAVAASGLRPSAVVWTWVTTMKLLPLALLVGLGVAFFSSVPAAPVPEGALSARAFGHAVLVVVFACQGFEIVPLLSGSAARPERSIPVATVGALVFAAALYVVLHYLAAHAVPGLGKSRAPLADAAYAYGGTLARSVVLAGANVSALGICFGMLNTTPRYLAALATDRGFGPWIGELDVRLVPRRALLATTLATLPLLVLVKNPDDLFVLSSLAVLAQFASTVTSLAALARRGERGLSSRHVALAVLSLAGIALVSRGAELRPVLIAAGVLALGEVLRIGARRRPA